MSAAARVVKRGQAQAQAGAEPARQTRLSKESSEPDSRKVTERTVCLGGTTATTDQPAPPFATWTSWNCGAFGNVQRTRDVPAAFRAAGRAA
jgi:hypothetical protein